MEQLAPGLIKAALELWQTTLAFLPRLAAALVLLLIGWLVARLLRLLTFRLIRRIGRFGSIEQDMKASGVDDIGPKAVATIIFWAVFLISFAAAGQVMGLAVVSGVLGQLARYLPSVLSGVVVVIAGVVVGNLARHAATSAARTGRVAHARVLGEITRFAVLAIAGVIALEQFGINSTVLVVALGLVIAGAIGGVALAFGLGSREAVSNLIAGRQLGQVYQPGQRIRVGELEGRIIRLEQSSVTLDTGDGRASVPARIFAETTSVLLDEGS